MGLYVITTRADGIVLTGAGSVSNIFNVDHVNHVTHTEPTSINSYEATIAQMNVEVDPSPSTGVSLPAAFSDELARLRFALSTLKRFIASGTMPPHWYTATGTFTAFVSPPPVAARIEQAVAETIPSGTSPIITSFNTVIYSTVAGMAGTLGISAPVAGTYIIGACLGFTGSGGPAPSGDFQVVLRRSLTGTAFASNEVFSTASMTKVITAEMVVNVPANTIFQCGVIQNSGSPQLLTQTPSRPAFWAALVGR
jgi:hypothetical protein